MMLGGVGLVLGGVRVLVHFVRCGRCVYWVSGLGVHGE